MSKSINQIISRQHSFQLGVNSSKTLTVGAPYGTVCFLIATTGSIHAGYGTLHHIVGYVTASRCSVTNIKTESTFSIDSSNTSALKFVLTNSATNSPVGICIIDFMKDYECSFDLS